MNVNFKLLQTFLLVADHGSFRKAAEESSRTPSAVSTQVRQLEDQVGVPLFHRTTRNVALTAEGQQLVAKAREAVATLAQGLDQLRESIQTRRGIVAFASSPSISATCLPSILLDFERSHPQVTVKVRELVQFDLFASVGRREVDFGLGSAVDGMSDLAFESLVDDDVCALLPPAHPLARQRRVTLGDLAGEPMIMFQPAGTAALRRTVDDAAHASGTSLFVKYEVQQPQTVCAFAAAGLGVAILPRIAIPAGLESRLRILPLGEPPIVRKVGIITARGTQLSPTALALAAQIRASLRATRAG